MSFKIAVLSDPHFHDTGFGGLTRRGDGLFLRTLGDTVASTRVFNESGPALRAVLDDIVARGISLVIIAGDLTDDGQAANWQALDELLGEYAAAHGIRFFATPGNHDQFAMEGRHLAKRALNPDGSFDLVASDAGLTDGEARDLVTSPLMYGLGYKDALDRHVPLGYWRDRRDLHWESPFGADDSFSARMGDVAASAEGPRAKVIDASYLVEPVEGLWLLSLDGNLYVPDQPGGEFSDRGEIGWTAALPQKPYLLEWVAGVVRRARAGGKTLVAFSHYPVTDISEGTYARETALKRGKPGDKRRMPDPEIAEAFMAAGLRVHFSGHWHLNNTGQHVSPEGRLVNIALPSLVALPAAYKIATIEGSRVGIETVSVDKACGFDVAFERYAAESGRNGGSFRAMFESADLGTFVDNHQVLLVRERHLPREWHDGFAGLYENLSLADLAEIAALPAPLDFADLDAWQPDAGARAPLGGQSELGFADMFTDFYRLRQAGGLALRALPGDRLTAYRKLIALYGEREWPEASVQGDIAVFLEMLRSYLDGRPSVDFSVDLETGEIGA